MPSFHPCPLNSLWSKAYVEMVLSLKMRIPLAWDIVSIPYLGTFISHHVSQVAKISFEVN
jgi:hypothetical protein